MSARGVSGGADRAHHMHTTYTDAITSSDDPLRHAIAMACAGNLLGADSAPNRLKGALQLSLSLTYFMFAVGYDAVIGAAVLSTSQTTFSIVSWQTSTPPIQVQP